MLASLRTVLVGFGRIAAGYAHDRRMARWFPYATHAQVLRAHPDFDWCATVDPDVDARANAIREWGVTESVADVAQLSDPGKFDVAVLATPPNSRLGILDQLPNLKAVIVEKPLGSDLVAARSFLQACAARNILVQVNFPRRGDSKMRCLSKSLHEKIGRVQAAFSLYGNGLDNNGSHIVDWARMFLGEIAWVRSIPEGPIVNEGPIEGDASVPFVLGFESGACLMTQPLTFADYRENSLEIWGGGGTLSFRQEGLSAAILPRVEHRFLEHAFEISSDNPTTVLTGQGQAIYELYGNLTRALSNGESLWSSGLDALRVMEIIYAIRRSLTEDGRRISV